MPDPGFNMPGTMCDCCAGVCDSLAKTKNNPAQTNIDYLQKLEKCDVEHLTRGSIKMDFDIISR
jgi:hypothetical protein